MLRHHLVLTKTVIFGFLLATLAGCQKHYGDYEDPEIAKKCSSVRQLLSKNYHDSNIFDFALISGGHKTEISGAELSNDQAMRIVEQDYICRAWVAGAVTSDQWDRYLLQSAATSMTGFADGDDNNSKESMTLYNSLEQFKLILIKQGKTQEEAIQLVNQVQKLAQDKALKSPQQRMNELHNTYLSLTEKIENSTELENNRWVDLNRDVAMIRIRIDQIYQQTNSTNQVPKEEFSWESNNLCVHFTIGSSELTNDAMSKIDKYLNNNTPHRIFVYGFADTGGSSFSNKRVSKNRATAVTDYIRHLVSYTKSEGKGETSRFGEILRDNRIAVLVADDLGDPIKLSRPCK